MTKTAPLALLAGIVVVGAIAVPGPLAGARQDARPAAGPVEAARVAAAQVPIDTDDIGGVVSSGSGPEAGVWVIAETSDLATKFRKIVVTDDRGRYLLPDLPDASYEVWVRGYGLVDSVHVRVTPGRTLALTAVPAPNAQAAAQYYPASYWYSLVQVPPNDAFPMTVAPSKVQTEAHPAVAASTPGPVRTGPGVINSQAEWVALLKCGACHQVGGKGTRALSGNLGTFGSSIEAWDRSMRAGQEAARQMASIDRFGRERGLAMLADWSDRIAAGEVPQAPPRPQGIERSLVLTLWDFATATHFVHDAISTDKRHPTVNAYGPVYGTDWSQDTIVTIDPVKHTKGSIKVPLNNEEDRKVLPRWSIQAMSLHVPSPYWGDEIIWDDPLNPHTIMMDGQGRPWFVSSTHKAADQAPYCTQGRFGTRYPMVRNTRGVNYYEPRTGKIASFDLCFNISHQTFGEDQDDTLYFSLNRTLGGVGWVKTRVLIETGDRERAQGWCAPILDYNGDGKLGAFTRPPEPADPALDLLSPTGGYGIAWHPVDGSVWYVSPGTPGKIVRMHVGANPPDTCTTEFYEPPFNHPKMPGVWGSNPRGIDIDRNGLVWTALSDSNHLASFDRRKCAVLRGPSATGTHCPEGWTPYPAPGPRFKGVTVEMGTDYFYYNWVDQFDVLGLGRNTPIATGTWSDSLLALDPATKKWTVLRVPYPLGFYTREMDGRIDDPNAGWKGRGLWAADETKTPWLNEGGKGSTSYVVHFQLRPDPLAK